jgi:hypothetical protein
MEQIKVIILLAVMGGLLGWIAAQWKSMPPEDPPQLTKQQELELMGYHIDRQGKVFAGPEGFPQPKYTDTFEQQFDYIIKNLPHHLKH